MLAQWALVVHVLGWVFWLGTDIGVFIACRHAERGDLSVETRLTLLEVGMLLDRLPRLAVPLVWGSGAVLSKQWGYEFVPIPCALLVAALSCSRPGRAAALWHYALKRSSTPVSLSAWAAALPCCWPAGIFHSGSR